MGEEKFTAIVVGAGPAGSTAAMVLAKEGNDVLLIEKGASPGSKNMFGGRMYCHALNRILPNFWEEAPVERAVARETVTFLHGGKAVSLTCRNSDWTKPPYHSVTLLRAEFDSWLASKAEEAGAELACNIRVDDLLTEDGRVVGIRAGEDEILADAVIAADGVNSLLAQKAGLAKMFSPGQVSTGMKQVIELPEETIRDRFGLEGNAGAVQLFVGECTGGMPGGGFLYTNKSSVSLGLVVSASALQRSSVRAPDLMEDFKNNPEILPLIEGGKVAEYSAHLIPEAGLGMMPRIYGDGILVAGDAAGFVLNLGYVIRGMDFAIASGEAAARAVICAKERGDFSGNSLSGYQELLKKSFVLQDLEAYRKVPEFMENERLYAEYPGLLTSIFTNVFSVDGSQPIRLHSKILNRVKESGLSLAQLAVDGWKGATRL
ncbi:MAG: FAD-dependent monooxygenase [Desulfobacteraceae bacterium]|nr:FAD-dependent monooxygenase [Desulfobacteraceae bacterium]